MDSILTNKDLILSAGHIGLKLAKVTHVASGGATVNFVLPLEEYDLFLDVEDLLFSRLDFDLVLWKEKVEAWSAAGDNGSHSLLRTNLVQYLVLRLLCELKVFENHWLLFLFWLILLFFLLGLRLILFLFWRALLFFFVFFFLSFLLLFN